MDVIGQANVRLPAGRKQPSRGKADDGSVEGTGGRVPANVQFKGCTLSRYEPRECGGGELSRPYQAPCTHDNEPKPPPHRTGHHENKFPIIDLIRAGGGADGEQMNGREACLASKGDAWTPSAKQTAAYQRAESPQMRGPLRGGDTSVLASEMFSIPGEI